MLHNRKARIAARRAEAVERARRVLQDIVNGSLDAYEGYRSLYGIYLGSSGLAEELKPFFRLPGIETDGCFHVDDQFRATICRLAEEWLRGEWPSSGSTPPEVLEKVGTFGVSSNYGYRVDMGPQGVVYRDADGEAALGYSWMVNGISLHPSSLRARGLAQDRVEMIIARMTGALRHLGYSVELF